MQLGKSSTDGYITLLLGYAASPFGDIGSYFRITGGLNEDDIQLILKQCISKFVSHEKPPGNYSIIDNSEFVYTMSDREKTLQLEYDGTNMKKNSFEKVLLSLLKF